MSEENQRIRRAQAEIAEQDKIVADAESAKAKALARKADLMAFIRVEREHADDFDWEAAQSPIMGALNAAAASFDASQRGAKKKAILTILNSYNTPMSTSAITVALGAYSIAGATTENTSPQLSTYKADGFVALVDEGWKITQKGREYLAQKN
jgi:hypothetical protein